MPLMTERGIGMDYGMIPESRIWDHAERLYITDPDDVDDFRDKIRAMESTYRDCTKFKEEPPASPQGNVDGRNPRNRH